MTGVSRPTDDQIADAILALAAERGSDKSLCPSEAARKLGGEAWRGMLKPVRRVALGLWREGRLTILRKGKPVTDEAAVRGVIRLSLPRDVADA